MQKKYEWVAIKAVVIIIRIFFAKERIDYAPKHMNQLLAWFRLLFSRRVREYYKYFDNMFREGSVKK